MTLESGYIKTFYAAIKYETDRIVDKVFITGVTSVVLDSISSGFNIATDLSNKSAFSGMLGFTEPELLGLIRKIVDFSFCQETEQKLLKQMQDLYGGYRFSHNSDVNVFNPSLCIDYLQKISSENFQKETFINGIDIDFFKAENFVKLCDDSVFLNDVCQRIQDDKSIPLDTEPVSLCMHKLTNLSRIELLSVLMYMGLLTWSGQQNYDLCCPNKSMKKYFLNQLE